MSVGKGVHAQGEVADSSPLHDSFIIHFATQYTHTGFVWYNLTHNTTL
jgi:hypothetical protein